jgi:hypothetical protein
MKTYNKIMMMQMTWNLAIISRVEVGKISIPNGSSTFKCIVTPNNLDVETKISWEV